MESRSPVLKSSLGPLSSAPVLRITWESHDAEQEIPEVQVSIPRLCYLGGSLEVIRIPGVIKSKALVSAVVFGMKREALGNDWTALSCYSMSCYQRFVPYF